MMLKSTARQTWALMRKNLNIITRKWFSTLLRSLILPIALLVLLLEIQNFSANKNKYDIGSPHFIRSLADSMQDSRPLVVVHNNTLGLDFPPVLEKIVQPLGSKVVHLDDESKVDLKCPVDYHGSSPCHAVVIFNDSPLSGRENASWSYSIRADPSLASRRFDVWDNDSAADRTQEEIDDSSRAAFQGLALYILSFVFFITMVPVAHHLSSMMAGERDSGMSQLIDAMGGGVAVPRVLSYVISFDLLYLPLWIILGAVFWRLLLPGQNAAIVIFWQIFTGWSVTSASTFGTAFFKKGAFASLWNSLIPILLAVIAAYAENITDPPAPFSQVVILSIFFPSMNYVYFFSAITKSEIAGIPLKMRQPIPAELLGGAIISGQGDDVPNWVSLSGPYFLWVILWVQIIVYPLLAILVEHLLYGNNRRRRNFNTTLEAENSHLAIETTDLVKQYSPSWFKSIFCCARTPCTKAIDGLDLASQKRQILCLLGPNRSGKTTTLDMLAGFQAPTGGSIHINAKPSQIGICPQRNVLWDNLAVLEHLTVWNILKGNTEDAASLEQLIRRCDLEKKKNGLAGNLSGGMKRKLQLACMLVGGSSICLLDEVTSGLDPLSRRVIWNVILGERAQRTMVLTTHFLDESEVLSDHIVIITLGKMKCQGTPAELKNKYGGGYRVHIPKSEDVSKIQYPVTEQKDRYIYRTPDSSSAARLLASLDHSRESELYITGPTIEDVFLEVSEEPHTSMGEAPEDISLKEPRPHRKDDHEGATSLWAIYSRQIWALLLKKFYILRSTCFLKGYEQPSCTSLIESGGFDSRMRVYSPNNMALGPPSVNSSVYAMLKQTDATYFAYSSYDIGEPYLQQSRADLENFIYTNHTNVSSAGGLWIGNDSTLAVYDAESGDWSASAMVNLLNQVRSGQPISGHIGELREYRKPEGGNSMIYVTIFCLLQALYPAFFALYPTYERRSKVRALQYSNGIRAFPLLFSYLLFDCVIVLLVSIICTVIMSPNNLWSNGQWFGIGYIWLVQLLYGIAATLFAYLVSMMARSQPSAFAFTVLFMALMYIISIVAFVVIGTSNSSNQMAYDGTAYGLGLIFPIQNLMRSLAVGLNTYIVLCRGSTMVSDPGSFYAHGGPIFLLVIQIIGLFNLLLWLEGGSFSWFSRSKTLPADAEKTALSGRPDVDAETRRVTSSESDLLRVLHVSKNFGSSTAVDDVSLGLQRNEILALLGPNGAGKTTTINMVRGDMAPSSGHIFLEGVDVQRNRRLAQKNLGVCPQFDALDMLTVREHLHFYARCKGVADIRADVAYVMGKVGIAQHAAKMAGKLSGGNKRKLSLAIALLGNPPVLLLDEPSSAMDAASKRVLWKTLEAVAPGRSVLITTHSMEEADALATRAAIIAKKVLAIGSTEQLRKTHSNEYHVHLILKSAPLSSKEEMAGVAHWVQNEFEGVRFEGENLGGQVRFIVGADSKVPGHLKTLPHASTGDGPMSPVSPVEVRDQRGTRATQSFTRYLIETLELKKESLGLDCYSISAATMESVFLRVVKESDAEEDETVEKKPWWQW
ncbi:hypothetical protein F5Y15DRAFT_431193 [Xylariaceae sp. FL0016]|nr:hypothetical protein F5Y15DRAFT_431193 [Xylariaceae sp. FL0016]